MEAAVLRTNRRPARSDCCDQVASTGDVCHLCPRFQDSEMGDSRRRAFGASERSRDTETYFYLENRMSIGKGFALAFVGAVLLQPLYGQTDAGATSPGPAAQSQILQQYDQAIDQVA